MELDSEHLRDDVQFGHESGLENDGDVGSVKELDVVAAAVLVYTKVLAVASW